MSPSAVRRRARGVSSLPNSPMRWARHLGNVTLAADCVELGTLLKSGVVKCAHWLLVEQGAKFPVQDPGKHIQLADSFVSAAGHDLVKRAFQLSIELNARAGVGCTELDVDVEALWFISQKAELGRGVLPCNLEDESVENGAKGAVFNISSMFAGKVSPTILIGIMLSFRCFTFGPAVVAFSKETSGVRYLFMRF